MQIKDRHIKHLTIDGKPSELVKELALGVTYALDKIEFQDNNGEKIPLSQAVIEFGQLLNLMGQKNSKELDGKE